MDTASQTGHHEAVFCLAKCGCSCASIMILLDSMNNIFCFIILMEYRQSIPSLVGHNWCWKHMMWAYFDVPKKESQSYRQTKSCPAPTSWNECSDFSKDPRRLVARKLARSTMIMNCTNEWVSWIRMLTSQSCWRCRSYCCWRRRDDAFGRQVLESSS